MAPIDTTRLLTIQQAAHRLGVSGEKTEARGVPSATHAGIRGHHSADSADSSGSSFPAFRTASSWIFFSRYCSTVMPS